ncbi:MAG: hypothetical protein HXY22_07615 [Alphaproteobacteria bacterium]|nr:hypothetical protein [Alphaproteobacteria bacterium]
MIRRLRIVAVTLALAAMTLRALVPAGWMPSSTMGMDGIPLVLCTLEGVVTVTLGPDGQPQAPQKKSGHTHEVCPFAGAAPLAAAVDPAGITLPDLAAHFVRCAAFITRLSGRALYAPHHPRGPPAPPFI